MSPSSSTTNVAHSLENSDALSLRSKKQSRRREHTKKSIVTYSEPPSPSSDFILFPESPIVENHTSSRRERSQRVRRDLIADGLLPAAHDDLHDDMRNKMTPLQRAAKRRSKLNHDAVIHQTDERRWKDTMVPPPAPSPPRLGTPDLDDLDEDLWSCCSWSESSVESYILASKRTNAKGANDRSKTDDAKAKSTK